MALDDGFLKPRDQGSTGRGTNASCDRLGDNPWLRMVWFAWFATDSRDVSSDWFPTGYSIRALIGGNAATSDWNFELSPGDALLTIVSPYHCRCLARRCDRLCCNA